MFSRIIMVHYTLQVLICFCWYYICTTVAQADSATTGNKGRYEIVIPQRVNMAGEFVSHVIPQHFKLSKWSRRKRDARIAQHTDAEDTVHYLVPIDGEKHHLVLRPNLELLSPGAMTETHAEDGVSIRRIRDIQCHFKGRVRNYEGSTVALSTCNGLAGYIRTKRGHFVIEPAERTPTNTLTDDRHPHLVYQRHSYDPGGTSNCETRGIKKRESLFTRKFLVHKDKPKDVTVDNMYTTEAQSDLYLELLLVIDKTFLNHHQNSDVEQYILTIMNMAHNLFLQESLGRAVYLVIVRIIRLEHEEEEINLSLIKDPCRTLEHFQKWQNKLNPGNDTHPNHHDLALLLTRVDIFSDDSSRDLLGVSFQASVCDPHNQAVICEDVGITLGYVVAHEIGHSLGLLHDTLEDSGCNATLPNGLSTVMSPNIVMSTGDWSMCSKKFLQISIESGFGHCLLDHPVDYDLEYVDVLPGVVYDGNWQCRSRFGSSASLCDTAPRCDTIVCEVPKEGCIDTNTPPADGTPCGEDKWCYRGECLQVGMRPGARDGGWGPWSTWSKCTRTCGTGVSFAERRCDSPTPANGGEFCKGSKKKYRICATEPCPQGAPRFRDIQCAQFDKWIYPEDGETHQWRAHMTLVDDPCALYCYNKNMVVAKLKERVTDGTSCMKGIRDICISGNCVNIPCDLNIGSGAVEDVCGVCHGDGTTCALKEGLKFFDTSCSNAEKNSTKDEILKLIDVPEGSQNIRVEETMPSESKIEVRNADGSILLIPGDELGLFDLPGSRAWLGMIHVQQETLHIPGPVIEPLSIWVSPKQNVTFKYSLAVATEKRSGAFSWDFVNWNPCSVICGVGTMVSIPKCVEQSSGIVDDRFCDEPKPKSKEKPCEGFACQPRWLIGDWQKCRKRPQVTQPMQSRIVRCAKNMDGKIRNIIFVCSSLCPQPKPVEQRGCELPVTSCGGRSKRKVFHRPNRLKSKNTNDMVITTKHVAKISEKQRHRRSDNDTKRIGNEELQKFTLERGRTDADKINCHELKFEIRGNPSNKDFNIKTVKTLVGKRVIDEMEKIQKKTPEIDQIK